MKTHYLIYKITNTLNGKCYIGQHKTNNLNDGYFGSGKLLKTAIAKYGISNFDKEILFDFDSFDEMNNKEIELVTEALVLDPLTYNIQVGGQECGWNKTKNTILVRDITGKCSRVSKTNELYVSGELVQFWFGRHHAAETIQKIKDSIGLNDRTGSNNPNFQNYWDEPQRKLASIRQQLNHSHLSGDANPAKRPDVRKKLSDGKLGEKNPNAVRWRLYNVEHNIEYIFVGGLKRQLKNYELTYSMFTKITEDHRITYNKQWELWKL